MALAIRHGGDEATAWETAKARFIDGLPEDEQILFHDASPENLFYSSSAAFKKYDANSKLQAVRRKIQPMVDSIAAYGKAMDVFANMSPMVLGALWGSLRVVLHMAQEYEKYFEKLVDMFVRIGDVLPRFLGYEMLFPSYVDLRQGLSKAYFTIIEFCVDARSVFANARSSSIGWATCKATWKPFAKRFEKYLSDLRTYQKNVEKQVALCHMTEAKKAQEMQRQDRIAKERQRLLGLLSQLDYRRHHRRLQKLRHQGTGSWLSELPSLRSWLQSDTSGCFCCFGIPGSGKTILASAIIDSLSPFFTEMDSAMCYYYCDYANVSSLDVSVILGTLIRQLLERIQIPTETAEIIDDYFAKGGTKPLPEDLINLLTKVLSPFKRIMVVLDGLDELAVLEQKHVIQLIHRLTQLSDINAKVLVFSRREERLIRMELQRYEFVDISVNLVRDDLARFIMGSVDLKLKNHELSIQDPGLKQIIIDTLIKGAEDMFLWVKFQLEELCEALTDDEVRYTLKNLPKDLASTYARILERYCTSKGGETRIRIMQKIFPWIACARRPFTVEELNEAFAIDVNDRHLHREKIPTDHNRILEACGSLILFDKDDRTVSFAHNTVKQFLVDHIHDSEVIRALQFTFDEADFRIGEACVTYLCFSDFETQIIKKAAMELPIQSNLAQAMAAQIPFGKQIYSLGSWLSTRLVPGNPLASKPFLLPLPKAKALSGELEGKYRLLNYAVHNWTWHTTQFTPAKSPLVWERLHALTFVRQLAFEVRPWTSLDGASPSEDYQFLHLGLFQWAVTNKARAAFLKLLDRSISSPTLEVLFDHVGAVDLLIQAVEIGHNELIQLMYEKGKVNVELRDAQGRRLLSLASSKGHMAVVEQLLKMGARVNVEEGQYSDALQAAVRGGYLPIVERLLQENAEVNAEVSAQVRRKPPLLVAAEGGHLAIVDRLLRAKAMVNFKSITDEGEQTALQAAASGGHLAVVERLLQAKAEVNTVATTGGVRRTPLTAAAEGGHLAVVDRLLQAKAMVDKSGYCETTALQAAAEKGHLRVVERLLQAKAKVEPPERYGPSALHAAAGNGHLRVVERLIQAKADVSPSPRGTILFVTTAFQAAAEKGHLRVVERLLQAKADVNVVVGIDGETALRMAAKGGHLPVVERLLQAGAVVNLSGTVSYSWKTPLQAAAEGGHLAVVERLLQAGADISGRHWERALQAAKEGRHAEVVKRLKQAITQK